jgi:hypothetical protein
MDDELLNLEKECQHEADSQIVLTGAQRTIHNQA